MKKKYQSPELTKVQMPPAAILAGSTGATIPGAGWDNAKETTSFIDDNDEENEGE